MCRVLRRGGLRRMSLHLRGSLPQPHVWDDPESCWRWRSGHKGRGKGFLSAADALCKTGESNVAAPYREEKADTQYVNIWIWINALFLNWNWIWMPCSFRCVPICVFVALKPATNPHYQTWTYFLGWLAYFADSKSRGRWPNYRAVATVLQPLWLGEALDDS